jgi:hypothetical protein
VSVLTCCGSRLHTSSQAFQASLPIVRNLSKYSLPEQSRYPNSEVGKRLIELLSALEHFGGSKDCSIKQADIYLAPYSPNTKVSPFCSNRANLLEALSNGGRHGYDEPYVGKGKSFNPILQILLKVQVVLTAGSQLLKSVSLWNDSALLYLLATISVEPYT